MGFWALKLHIKPWNHPSKLWTTHVVFARTVDPLFGVEVRRTPEHIDSPSSHRNSSPAAGPLSLRIAFQLWVWDRQVTHLPHVVRRQRASRHQGTQKTTWHNRGPPKSSGATRSSTAHWESWVSQRTQQHETQDPFGFLL